LSQNKIEQQIPTWLCIQKKQAITTKQSAMEVVIAYFTTETLSEWLQGDKKHLNDRVRTFYKAGTIVVLANLSTKAVVGVCMLADWSEKESPCREHHLLDNDTYAGDNAKYNRYEICISNLRLLKNPLPFDDIRTLVGGDPKSKKCNNMWRGFQGNFVKAFGADDAVVHRYKMLAQSLL